MWGSLLVGIAALAAREFLLLWLPVEFILLGGVRRAGILHWRSTFRMGTIHEERLEGERNTLEDEIKHLQEMEEGSSQRLRRYQQLRQIANAFSTSLSLQDLLQQIVQATGEVVQKADVVLLYLVNPATLILELKSVWRRSGMTNVKAKTGDPFDLWVMRQAQPLLVEDPLHDFRFPQMTSQKVGRPLGALLAVPLMSEHRLLGVLRVESTRPHGLGPDELRLVRIVGDLASLGIENAYLYHRMAELAMMDDLTGLMVRVYFQKRLTEELARAAHFEKPLSLLLIDIDHFKVYNDTFGHSSGDKLLRHVAQFMSRVCRPGEIAARFGGEEFVFLLSGVDAQEAAVRAEWIRSQVEASSVELRRSLTRTTVSIGVATFPKDGATVDSLLQRSDERLYRAKTSGRNRVCTS